MRLRLIPLLSAGLLTAAPLAVLAAPASAATCTAPEVYGTEVVPHTVVVGTTKVKGFDVYTDLAKNGCTISSVKVTISSPKHTLANQKMAVDTTSDGVTSYVYGVNLNASSLENGEAGTWKAKSVTRWSGSPITTNATFRVLRASTLTTNATPEPVKAGADLVVRGKLSRADWKTRHYVAFAAKPVTLQFRPTGGSYADVATVTSSSKGAVKKTVKAGVDGCYRFVFAGSSTTNHVTSAGDCVDVR